MLFSHSGTQKEGYSLSTSRQQRLHPTKQKKRRWPKVLIGFLIVVAVLVGLVIAFPFQTNNALRSAMGGRDTPVDTAAKNELIKKLDSTKTGSVAGDELISEAVSRLRNTSMQQVRDAAQSSSAAAKLIQQNTGLSDTQAQALSSFVFSHPQFSGMRTAVADGDWLQAYREYQQLTSSGDMATLRSDIQGQ